MELGANAIITLEPAPDETDVGKMLAKYGMNINRANPSTFGTLLTSAFLGAAKEVQNKSEINSEDLILMGRGAVTGIKNRGKAEVGDKTMLDSLIPAMEAYEKSASKNISIIESLKAAVSEAEAGMQATANMRAKLGRGSYRQDGTIGVRDGGAVAMYYLIESFARQLNTILDRK
jgi:dihydroxyacetone kinase-like protein